MHSLLRRKARVLDSLTHDFNAMRKSGDVFYLEQLSEIHAKISIRVSRGPENMGPEQYRQEIAALRQDQEALEFLMSEQNAGKDMELRQLTIGDVQEALPQGAALLEIARYRPKSRRGATRHSDRYAA
ncbi:MAG TPA: hypothetical protein PKA58_22715, partial [Polyangium sp.]|nr:hypothetical protein [Polyangium sp.]